MTSAPMSYLLKNSAEMSGDNLPEQLNRLENENRALERRLHSKTIESSKLQQRLEKIESELHTYREMLQQINHCETPCE